jgi:hypothetical protein
VVLEFNWKIVFSNKYFIDTLFTYGPGRDEVTGEWRKLHNEELNDFHLTHYCAGDEIENEIGGAFSANVGGQRCV